MTIIYQTTHTQPGGDGQLGPINGISRSNTTRLSETFPVGVTKFEEEELTDVKVYFYKIYQWDLNPASQPSPDANYADLTPEELEEQKGFSPAFGYYNLNYKGAQPMSSVPIGGAGLPGGPFLPNIISTPACVPYLQPPPPAGQLDPASPINRRNTGWGNLNNWTPVPSSEVSSINKNTAGDPPVRLKGISSTVFHRDINAGIVVEGGDGATGEGVALK